MERLLPQLDATRGVRVLADATDNRVRSFQRTDNISINKPGEGVGLPVKLDGGFYQWYTRIRELITYCVVMIIRKRIGEITNGCAVRVSR